ncbi:hypothetical protein H312_00499 [Anncaliia algerae PRA339]|uniref:Uncharacterized protein n=1 Tax=Anncaliia algerae PRA339 TaxID=1288291 RepID=A0A059F4J7_9MICR|nr:hypothetical protein H312_00499 [Anncaliia algerae PRA339]
MNGICSKIVFLSFYPVLVLSAIYTLPITPYYVGNYNLIVDGANATILYDGNTYFINQFSNSNMHHTTSTTLKYSHRMFCVNFNPLNIIISIPDDSKILDMYLYLILFHTKQVSDSKLLLDKRTFDFLFDPSFYEADNLVLDIKNIIPVVTIYTFEMLVHKYNIFLERNKPHLRFLKILDCKCIADIIFREFENNPYDIIPFSLFYISVSDGFNHTVDPQTNIVYLITSNRLHKSSKEENILYLIQSWKCNRIYFTSFYEAYIMLIVRFYRCHFSNFENLDDFKSALKAYKWCVYKGLCIFFN